MIKNIIFTFELPQNFYDWYVAIDDDQLANDCLEIAFSRMFKLNAAKGIMAPAGQLIDLGIDPRDTDRDYGPKKVRIDLRDVANMVQSAYGWMLFELVFEKLGATFEVSRVRLRPKDRSLYVRVRCMQYD